MKLTPWFPGTVKPVRVGVYERDYNPSPTSNYCYWNGEEWSTREQTPKKALEEFFVPSLYQDLPWRGVLK